MFCEYCASETFYLMDNPDLGPCVCCTPDAMAALATQVAADNTVQEERDAAMAILDEAYERLAAYLVRHNMDPRAVRLPDPDLDALLNLLGD